MKKNVLIFAALLMPAIANADNVGGCGWGSKLFDGQRGVFPQVLAVTTNGSTGNQTFGITSGTSGCTQDGQVVTRWKTAAYIDANMNNLALDVSRGEGESLSSLASLAGVRAEDASTFNVALQQNFGKLFANPSVTSVEVAASLREVLAQNPVLAQYATNV